MHQNIIGVNAIEQFLFDNNDRFIKNHKAGRRYYNINVLYHDFKDEIDHLYKTISSTGVVKDLVSLLNLLSNIYAVHFAPWAKANISGNK